MKIPPKNRLPWLALGASLLSVTIARAGVLDDIGGAISSLRGQKSRAIGAAHAARSQADAQSQQVDFLHQRLLKTSRALDRASDNYAQSYRQMQRTERKIAALKAEAALVSQRYDDHKTQFGLRLASMQRHGQTNFLQVALGSASLSDLSRRTAYFQALTQRDAALQQGLKQDKADIAAAQNQLMAQWKSRRDAQQEAQRERNRIAQGEAEQLQTWKQMSKARLSLLSYALQQERSLGSIDGKIGDLRGRASDIISQNEARQARIAYEQARDSRIAARERALDEYREEMSRERAAMRAQNTFRARVRRRIVRNYTRSQAPRVASYSSGSRYGYRSNSRYRRGAHYRTARYTRQNSGSIRYARQSGSIPPQFAPRVGLMPRYAPRVELAPMPIEALQNPAKFTLPPQKPTPD